MNVDKLELAEYLTRDLALTHFPSRAWGASWSSADSSYTCKLLAFDPNLKSQGEKFHFQIPPREVSTAKEAPLLPEALLGLVSELQTDSLKFVDGLPESEQESHRRSIQLARHIQFMMFGACGERQELKKTRQISSQAYTKCLERTSSRKIPRTWYQRYMMGAHFGGLQDLAAR